MRIGDPRTRRESVSKGNRRGDKLPVVKTLPEDPRYDWSEFLDDYTFTHLEERDVQDLVEVGQVDSDR